MTLSPRLLKWSILSILILVGTFTIISPYLPEDITDFFASFFVSDNELPGEAEPPWSLFKRDYFNLIFTAFYILIICDSFRGKNSVLTKILNLMSQLNVRFAKEVLKLRRLWLVLLLFWLVFLSLDIFQLAPSFFKITTWTEYSSESDYSYQVTCWGGTLFLEAITAAFACLRVMKLLWTKKNRHL